MHCAKETKIIKAPKTLTCNTIFSKLIKENQFIFSWFEHERNFLKLISRSDVFNLWESGECLQLITNIMFTVSRRCRWLPRLSTYSNVDDSVSRCNILKFPSFMRMHFAPNESPPSFKLKMTNYTARPPQLFTSFATL